MRLISVLALKMQFTPIRRSSAANAAMETDLGGDSVKTPGDWQTHAFSPPRPR